MSRKYKDSRQSSGFSKILELLAHTFDRIPRIRSLGWGFLVAWGTISTFTDVFAPLGIQTFRAYWIGNMVATTVGLILFGFWWQHQKPTFDSDKTMGIGSIAIILSTIVMALFFSGTSQIDTLIQAAAGAISGIGMAAGTLCWGNYYASLDAQETESCVIFSLVLMIACYALSLLGEWLFSVCLLIALPLCSLVCFILINHSQTCTTDTTDSQPSNTTENTSSTTHSSPLSALTFLRTYHSFLRVGVGIIAASCSISILWSLMGSSFLSLSGDLFAISLLSGIVVAVVLVLYCVTFASRLNLNALYRWLIPLIMIAFSLFSWGNVASNFCGSLCNFAAQMGLDALTLIYFCELSSKHRALTGSIIGLGRGFLEGGILLGSLIAPALIPLLSTNAITINQTLLFLGAILVGVTMFAMLEQGIPVLQRDTIGSEAFHRPNRTTSLLDAVAASSPEDANELARLLFDKKCDLVAEKYHLSEREREILGYLARGRSLPFIRNELYISKSTTNTHVEHIYSKLGIHSKEDLISLVEESALE